MATTEAKLNAACEYLLKANDVALICHISPDADTLASALALREVLAGMGKSAEVFCDDFPHEHLQILHNFDKINLSEQKKFDLAVAVDFAEIQRGGSKSRYFKHALKTLTVDHHKVYGYFTDYALVDTEAAATAELCYLLIRRLEKLTGKEILNSEIASLLFAGIVTDTGCFQYSSVTSETMRIAAELRTFDFDAANLIFKLLRSQDKSVFLLKAKVLSKAKFYFDDRVAFITFRKSDFEEAAVVENTWGAISELTAIEGVKIAVSVCETGERSFRVSVRTSEDVDAADLVSVFGGGGHKRASGCRISGYYEDVLDKLLKACGDSLND